MQIWINYIKRCNLSFSIFERADNNNYKVRSCKSLPVVDMLNLHNATIKVCRATIAHLWGLLIRCFISNSKEMICQAIGKKLSKKLIISSGHVAYPPPLLLTLHHPRISLLTPQNAFRRNLETL